MNRRQALALGGAGLVAAVVAACRPRPPAPMPQTVTQHTFAYASRGAAYPDKASLPVGLGLGVNMRDSAAQHRPALLAQAIDALKPAWWHHWSMYPVSADPEFRPMIYPTPNWPDNPPYPVSLAQLNAWKRAVAEAGGDSNHRYWIAANEPEFTDWTPEQSAAAVAEQFRVLQDASLAPGLITPNSNIAHSNPERFEYLKRFCDAFDNYGIDYALGVHIYAWTTGRLDDAWAEFCTWFDAAFGTSKRVVVTECGAGPNRSIADWLAVMPWFYALVDDSRVAGVAPFASYPQTDYGGSQYPGMMEFDGSLTMYGHQYIAERTKLR